MRSEYDRAAAYLSKIPTPGEGARNDGLNRAAYALRERFAGLSESDFASLLTSWAAGMSPALSSGEVETTIRSAWRGAENRGTVGAKATAPRAGGSPRPRDNAPLSRHLREDPAPHAVTQAQPPGKYEVRETDYLPDPIPNGAVELLRAVFKPDEGVRIAQGRIGEDDGRETPKDEGAVFPAKTWVDMMTKRGGPNGLWSSSKGAGVFISINPMRSGGAKDADVTAYRHALVEIDVGLTREQQYALWIDSGIPCAAIINSGGKSVHAWVRVDAADRREYDERVSFLHAHFAAYGIDSKNKNPSRFSRLPDSKRGNGHQQLLGLNVGSASWTEWRKRLDGDALGGSTGIAELLDLDTTADPNCVLGFRDGKTLRYLCKGKSAWLLGPSGIGKSSLVTEFAVGWALGRAVWGIQPAKPLKSLIIQAENDQHDLAEMAQGIALAYGLFPGGDDLAAVSENVRFRSETRSVGAAFVDRLHRMLDVDRPDIVWIDPLLSFAGIDVSKQSEVSQFLRTLLNPVLEATGVVAIGVHHTGKPRSAKETSGWTAIDWAYSGLGSSELVNWARAVMLLRPMGEGIFNLMLAKRGRRAGATHPDGEPTSNLFLRHAAVGIRWEQTEPPQEPAEGEDSGQGQPRRQRGKGEKPAREPSKVDHALATCPMDEFAASLPAEGVGLNEAGRLLENWLATRGHDIRTETCRKTMIPKLVSLKKLSKVDGKYTRP